MKKNSIRKNTKRIFTSLLVVLVSLVLIFTLRGRVRFPLRDVKISPTLSLNQSGHGVFPNTTPFPTRNGMVRFSEYDPLSTSFSIREAGRQDVIVSFSRTDVENAMVHSSIVGVNYVAKSNMRSKQLRQVDLAKTDFNSDKIATILQELHGKEFSFSFVPNEKPPFYLISTNRYSDPIKMLYNEVLVLNLTEVQGINLAYVAGTEDGKGGRVLNDVLPIKYSGSNTPIRLLTFDKVISNLKAGNYYMFWRDYRSLPEFFYTDLGPGSKLVLSSIHPVYLAQSQGLIPGYMICGYQELLEADGRLIHYDACGVTEAVDYGDY